MRGRGAVDLVGHQQLREDRAGDEAEAALAAGAFLQHFGAENVGRHQVGRELDAPGVETEHDAHGLDQLGLGEAGHADQQRVAAGEHGDQRALDHDFLAEDHRADRGLGCAHMGGGRFRRAHDHVFELFQIFAACYRHDFLVLSSTAFGPLCRRIDRCLNAMQQTHQQTNLPRIYAIFPGRVRAYHGDANRSGGRLKYRRKTMAKTGQGRAWKPL